MHSEQAALEGYLTWHHCGTNSMRCIDVERDWRAKLREAPAPPLRKGEFTRHLAMKGAPVLPEQAEHAL